MSGKRIWVTGASGFLGGNVVETFDAAGWIVSGIDIAPPPPNRPLRVAHWVSDRIGLPALESLAAHGLPDCIFHAAGNSSVGGSFEEPLRDFEDSALATARVLDFIRRKAPDAMFILPSSAAVYGACPADALSEDRPPSPLSPYGRHKLMAESLCAEASENFGIRTVAIRYFSLYGAGLRKQLLWDLGNKAVAAKDAVELFGTGRETRDMLDVRDAARMVLSCAERAGKGMMLVNGGTGRSLCVREIAVMLLDALGLDLEVRFNGIDRLGDPKHFRADIRRAEAMGLFSKIAFEDGIADYAHWFRAVQ